jgi:DNA invertase Pin-like site-specific DNA recombinase
MFPPLLRQLAGPKKFLLLGGDFQNGKNKRHRPGRSRTASTEGNFENIEEFIRIVGGITVDEIAKKFGLSRSSVRKVIHKNLQFKNC